MTDREKPLYLVEFPDFDHDLPTIAGFEDTSWHNDVCPCLSDTARNLILWCEYRDIAKRETGAGHLYTLVYGEYGASDDQVRICGSDDIDTIVAAIPYATPLPMSHEVNIALMGDAANGDRTPQSSTDEPLANLKHEVFVIVSGHAGGELDIHDLGAFDDRTDAMLLAERMADFYDTGITDYDA